jgi:hypothetical protein
MTLINFDGLAFFGPGSEWFWIMLQFALVAITLVGIYRQLQAQRSATEVALRTRLDDQINETRSVHMDLRAAMYVLQGGTAPHVATSDIANWMENVGDLVERGLVSREYVWNNFRAPIQKWWAAMAPTIRERRKVEGHLLWVGFEKLAVEVARMDRQNGLSMDLSPDGIRLFLEQVIMFSIQQLELDKELEEGVIPPWPPATDDNPASVSSQ